MEELIIKEKELKEEIIKLINSSNLPAIILRPILKDLLEQVAIAEKQQYEKAIKNNRLKEEDAKGQ